MKLFMSFRFDKDCPHQTEVADNGKVLLTSEQFVHRVSYYLSKQPDLEVCCWNEGRDRLNWDEIISNQLDSCNKFVLFWDKDFGSTQQTELKMWVREKHQSDYTEHTILVKFPGTSSIPKDDLPMHKYEFSLDDTDLRDSDEQPVKLEDNLAKRCAREIHKNLKTKYGWIHHDGLPIGYPFDYEKAIIEDFVKGNGRLLTEKRLQQGCPIKWPEIDKIKVPKEKFISNPIQEPTVGRYRKETEQIIVDARSIYHQPSGDNSCCLVSPGKRLSFLEAGPRENICYPLLDDLKIGIVVSGGIAPGINAVIAGVCQRHKKYEKEQAEFHGKKNSYPLKITMYRDGFSGMLAKRKVNLDEKYYQYVMEQANQGGSMISTSRHDVLLLSRDPVERNKAVDDIVDRLKDDGIDILYVIGGEGSMRAAHTIWTRLEERYKEDDPHYKIPKQISVIGIPKTMDNDVLWVWQAFGFLSAVEKAKEFITQLDTESKSNPRLCIMQLFGSDSGFVVSHAALASGVCKAALIPEVGFTMAKLSEDIRERLEKEFEQGQYNQSPYGIILLAETAIPRDVEDYIDNPEYPDLKLDEQEKTAVRNFIGSELLNIDDIVDWKALCKNIYGWADSSQSLHKDFWLFLPKEIRDIIRGRSDEPPYELAEDVKCMVVKSLNDVIRKHDFISKPAEEPQQSKIQPLADYILYIFRLSQESENEIEQLLKDIQTNQAALNPKLKFQQLSTYPLSYEAKVTLGALEKLISEDYRLKSSLEKKTNQDIWVKHFKGYCGKLYPELSKMYNRLLLEKLLSGNIKKKSSPGERRVHGQTPDGLRSASLKIVSTVLQKDIKNKMQKNKSYWEDFRVFVNEPRHLIRSIPPSVSDVIFGQRLGILAVDNAMAGYTDFMVSQWMTEYVLVPLELVVLGRKRVPQDGIFWKSVLANTGQQAVMV